MNSVNQSLIATIAFGFLMTLSSGLGQTFLISLFNPELRNAFALSHGDIGGLYFAGTLLSALTVVWVGKLIDQIDLRLYTGLVTIGLALACSTMASVNSTTTLIVAFFMLRLFGQGLSGHTGITTVSRVAAAYRGRSVSVAGLGYSSAEILLPVGTLMMIGSIGWRSTWQVFAILEIALIAVVAQLLLRHISVNQRDSNTVDTDSDSWTRNQVIKDKRFWRIVPAIFSPPVISTALFFHQQNLAISKGFTLTYWATGIAAYSVSAVLASLVSGILVDRYSGAMVVRFYLIPFIASVLIAVWINTQALPFIYYALIGATVGIGTPSVSALWLELYGTRHIGAIRALTHACMVFGTALGPFIFGYLLDTGVGWNMLLCASAIWMIIASVLLITTKLHTTSASNTAVSQYSAN